MPVSTIENAAALSVAPTEPERRAIPTAAFWVISVLGIVAGVYYIHQVREAMQMMMHLSVYQIAGQRVVDGVSIYDTPLLSRTRGVWEFVYTPFAALLFVPLVNLHDDVFTYVALFGAAAVQPRCSAGNRPDTVSAGVR
ncbi:hypothetical protein AB0L63_32665 [Nocardia sp. NPDC051990]|uniref:hypothetical protein n=1 Tax=Nocardia sp. NPDC051990 TaxID=3155285 RepID=UPI00341524BA